MAARIEGNKLGRTIVLQIVLLFTICPGLLAQNIWKDVYKESAWADRDRWQKADSIIFLLGLKPGSTVADIGSHEGYMTVRMARVVGADGKVFAVDLKQERLDALRLHIKSRKLNAQVVTVLGEESNPKLAKKSVDAILVLDTYHEIKEGIAYLKFLAKALKPGGHLVICEPLDPARADKPRDVQALFHEIALSFAESDLKQAGFTILIRKPEFVDRTSEKGDKMWLIVATVSR